MAEGQAFQQGGTDQLLQFAGAIYLRILEIEQKIGHAGDCSRGAVGSLAFLRLDISLFWVPSEGRYRMCLNEIQPGTPGMFKFDPDPCAVAAEFVDGIKRGSVDM